MCVGSGVSTNSGVSNDNWENYWEDMIDIKKIINIFNVFI